jgi:riboflavin kinase/FMN adenylyltransferase
MKVLASLRSLGNERHPIVLAVGFFDGVHKGHQKVVQVAVNKARRTGGQAWVLTFDPHPLDVLSPSAAPLLLTSIEHRQRLLESLGLDGCIVMSFNHRLAGMEPVAFARLLRHSIPTLSEVIVGQNWRFGKHGTGDTGLLAKLGREIGFKATVVKPAIYEKKPVSSTRIRAEIKRGNLKKAAAMLGRPFSILGRVIHGRAVGRKIGFPTANLDFHSKALPPYGIYAARALVDGVIRDGVVNLGINPTFEMRTVKPLLELHIFDFSGNLYGRDVEVFFIKRLRNERRFGSVEKLTAQIARDIATARRVLKRISSVNFLVAILANSSGKMESSKR